MWYPLWFWTTLQDQKGGEWKAFPYFQNREECAALGAARDQENRLVKFLERPPSLRHCHAIQKCNEDSSLYRNPRISVQRGKQVLKQS